MEVECNAEKRTIEIDKDDARVSQDSEETDKLVGLAE